LDQSIGRIAIKGRLQVMNARNALFRGDRVAGGGGMTEYQPFEIRSDRSRNFAPQCQDALRLFGYDLHVAEPRA
jgi:hypothetical protein